MGQRIRGLAIATAAAFLLTVVTFPARAFAPVAVIGAKVYASAGAYSYLAGSLAGMVGLIGMYLEIEDAQQNKIRVPLGPNQNNEPPAPAVSPSVAPTQTGGGSPVAATSSNNWCSSHTFGGTYQDCGVTYFGNPSAAAECAAAGYSGLNEITMQCNGQVGSLGSVGVMTCPDGYTLDGTNCNPPPLVQTCPPGYTLNGSSCDLQNARQASDDKTCDLLVSMGQFSTADDMNCSSTADGSKLAPMIRDGKVIAYGKNSNGDPLMWEVTPGTTKYTVRQYTQVETATETQVQTAEITVDPATSEITSVSASTSPGSLASPSAQSVPTTTDPQTQVTTENTPTVTQDETKAADKITCGLPGTPKCSIDDTSFSGAPLPPATSTFQPSLDAPKNTVENLADPVITWADWFPSLLPGSATSCHPIEFRGAVTVGPAAGLDSTTELDLCPYFDYARMILGWLFGLGAVLYIWRLFTGSQNRESF